MSVLRRCALSLLLWAALWSSPAVAVEPDEVLPDARLEQRARALSAELRCLVCQNQSIDDSHAGLARDLRMLVRDRLKAGETDTQVRDYLVARYGDFILLKPPFKPETALLWGLPFLLLGGGAIGLLLKRRREGEPSRALPLTAEEQAEIGRLVETERD